MSDEPKILLAGEAEETEPWAEALRGERVRRRTLRESLDELSWTDVLLLAPQSSPVAAELLLGELMRLRPRPVLVIGSLGAGQRAFWLERGALDVLGLFPPDDLSKRLRDATQVGLVVHPRIPRALARPLARSSSGDLRVVGVVASTGGPGALQAFLGQIPREAPLCLLVVQHMSAGFLPFFARTLDRDCPLPVSLAHPGARVRAGQVWLAPGDQHLRLEADRTLSLGPPEGREPHVPSGDVLLRSLAEIEGEAGVAVVLSGMGEDGARGALAVAQAGGLVLAQDEASSAVFGMPAATQALGATEELLPPAQLARRLLSR
ncbi:MAG TPA: chemotaxis response regulator protein-glutamate methylesterase [Planctomycetes bacterium]|nr:chemotaxis response regulator protein-glutamate methylesterase [Planctomycetota bacterium]